MRSVTLAAIQPPNQHEGSTPWEKKQGNVGTSCELMEKAAITGADLVCLPETFQVRGLDTISVNAMELADEEGGSLATELCEFARQHNINIVAPVLGRYGDTLRNVAWIISRRGDIVGRYFKVHLTNSERERGVIPGDDWPVFELDIGRIGVMTCHDNGFPESARCLALNGAEVVCWPHVQSAWEDIGWDITLRSRAIDNGIFIVSSCYGVPPQTAWRPGMMMGRSGVVGPDGTVLVDGGRTPGVYATTIDLDQLQLKHDFTYIGDHDYKLTMEETRRPETYSPLTRTAASARTSS